MADTEFTPIPEHAEQAMYRPADYPDITVLHEETTDEIRDLLLGKRVEKVDGDHLRLSDGTVIRAMGQEGGCSCGAGDYALSVLNEVDNIITSVEFDFQPGGDGRDERQGEHPDDPEDSYDGFYRIFVFAEDEKINLVQFDGSDGNGYYGTGFHLLVRKV